MGLAVAKRLRAERAGSEKRWWCAGRMERDRRAGRGHARRGPDSRLDGGIEAEAERLGGREWRGGQMVRRYLAKPRA